MKIYQVDAPYTLLVGTDDLEIGDQLADDVYTDREHLLTQSGRSLTAEDLRRFEEHDIRTVWVERTAREWLSEQLAHEDDYDIVNTYDITPPKFQIIINLQGSFSAHQLQAELQLLQQFGEELDLSVDLQQYTEKLHNLVEQEDSLREQISNIENDQLERSYRAILEASYPQYIDSDADGPPRLGRRIQRYLDQLSELTDRIAHDIINLGPGVLHDLAQNARSKAEEPRSFGVFEFFYDHPQTVDDQSVSRLSNDIQNHLRALFYEQTVGQLAELKDFLWREFSPDLPHWILALTRPGENHRGVLLAQSINTTLITSQLYRSANTIPDMSWSELLLGSISADIGMVTIPQTFFYHQRPLNKRHRKRLQQHPRLSSAIIKEAGDHRQACHVAIRHHERVDGSGYPERYASMRAEPGLVQVADAYSAMVTSRPWRDPLAPRKAFEELKQGDYSSDWVQVFEEQIGPYPVGSLVTLSNRIEAVVVDRTEQPYKPAVLPLRFLRQGRTHTINLADTTKYTITGHGPFISNKHRTAMVDLYRKDELKPESD